MYLVGPLPHRGLGVLADVDQDSEHSCSCPLLEGIELGQELVGDAAQPIGDEDDVGPLEATSGLDDLPRLRQRTLEIGAAAEEQLGNLQDVRHRRQFGAFDDLDANLAGRREGDGRKRPPLAAGDEEQSQDDGLGPYLLFPTHRGGLVVAGYQWP